MNRKQLFVKNPEVERTCNTCEANYRPSDDHKSNSHYFSSPYDYIDGVEEYCLACWLGVGPRDIADDEELKREYLDSGDLAAIFQNQVIQDSSLSSLAILPISRISLEQPILFPGDVAVFPEATAQLDQLRVIENNEESKRLAEMQSALSRVTVETFHQHALIVFPFQVAWDIISQGNHAAHLELIRMLSAEADTRLLDLARYQIYKLQSIDDLPGRSRQLHSNKMMSGALLYNEGLRESRIIGGQAFTHWISSAFPMTLYEFDANKFARNGETGNIVKQALALYTAMLETNTETTRFVQALSLLEFLTYPTEYKNFKDVKKAVAKYAVTEQQKQRISDRLYELTGKTDADGNITGYRTRIVHMVQKIEQIAPDQAERKELFKELDGYLRMMIDHMIDHSELSWGEYLELVGRK